uniref:Uncharacterized protein n=1 Tax=Photinus pyralis TaxID=7054 RepID=A0A1Y1LBK9_PHOPY
MQENKSIIVSSVSALRFLPVDGLDWKEDPCCSSINVIVDDAEEQDRLDRVDLGVDSSLSLKKVELCWGLKLDCTLPMDLEVLDEERRKGRDSGFVSKIWFEL